MSCLAWDFFPAGLLGVFFVRLLAKLPRAFLSTFPPITVMVFRVGMGFRASSFGSIESHTEFIFGVILLGIGPDATSSVHRFPLSHDVGIAEGETIVVFGPT